MGIREPEHVGHVKTMTAICNWNMTRSVRVRSARLIRQFINRARRLCRDDSRH